MSSSVLAALKFAADLETFPSIAVYYCRSMPHCPLLQRPVKDHSVLWFTLKHLRSTMSDSRLNGLALLYVHRDILLNYDSVIDDFPKGNRRLEFW